MNESGGAVKSATRVLDLLEMLSAEPGQVGVSEVARRLGIPKSSTHMLLATLEARGYVVGDEDRRFHLNPIFGNGGRSWVGGSQFMLIGLARASMERLAQATQESSFLGVQRDEESFDYVAKVVTPRDLRCDTVLHRPRPLHSTSVGLVILAFQLAGRTERFLQKGRFERFTPRTMSDAKQIRAELEAVRKRGYSVANDTNSPGASGIAAPIFDAAGTLAAALNVSAPTSRFEPLPRRIAAELVRVAAFITRQYVGKPARLARKL